jgi:redox-sensing transcriptional repressor
MSVATAPVGLVPRRGGKRVTGQAGGARESGRARTIPEATVARLAVYLRVLSGLGDRKGHRQSTISSEELARSAGVNSAKLRKDLSFLGSYGIRGVGYEVGTLTEEISRTLGAHRAHRVALVGLGNLGQALAGYPGFAGRGFVISALFDADPGRVGREVAGLPIHHIRDAVRLCRSGGVTIGVIATPASAAQEVADTLVAAGIRSILNFAPGVLAVPEDVQIRHVDLALELQILAFHESRRSDDGADEPFWAGSAASSTLAPGTQRPTAHPETGAVTQPGSPQTGISQAVAVTS